MADNKQLTIALNAVLTEEQLDAPIPSLGGQTARQLLAQPDTTPNTLTIEQARYLGDLIRGVESGARLRYYPDGADSADRPVTAVLRAFAHEGGGFWPHDKDIRDAYVHTSGMFEHWYPVRELIDAIANLDGRFGADKPIAVIENV